MIIPSHILRAALDRADRARYYHWCADISLAGEDYKVSEVVCFAENADDPLSGFAQVKKYDAGFLLILLYADDDALLCECMDYVDTVIRDFSEVEVRTPYPHLLASGRITSRYTVTLPEDQPNPVYYIHTQEELTCLPMEDGILQEDCVTVSLFREEDKADIAQAVQNGALDAEYMNAEMFVPCTVFRDVKWYILRVNGEPVGYLRAKCGYENIYDIGWLYVEPRFRGHGYAPQLVSAFSHDMFAGGCIPHYGYAISDASARVAEKCGFVCDRRPVCRCLTPR